MVLAAVALLEQNARPSDAEAIRALDGNVCRCCAYPRILAAVRLAATRIQEGRR
jgi:aerobic-type carbon monoxide dehydrogenase small subunit (CoxS/CutS family)